MVEGCKLSADVTQDTVITYDNVVLPPDRLADHLRAEQHRHFRNEVSLEDCRVLRHDGSAEQPAVSALGPVTLPGFRPNA